MLLNKTKRAPSCDYTVINLACSIANFSNIAWKKSKMQIDKASNHNLATSKGLFSYSKGAFLIDDVKKKTSK